MRILTLLLAVLAGTLLSTAQETNTLIPRETLFQEKEITRVDLSKDGEKVYYQRSSSDPGRLFYLRVSEPSQEYEIRFPDPVVRWECTYNDGICAVLQASGGQEVYYWSYATKQARRLDYTAAQSHQLLALSPKLNTKVAVRTRTADGKASGLYLVDLNGGATKWIMGEEPYNPILFSDLFDPLAAQAPGDAGGTAYFVRRNHEWEKIREYPYDQSMLLGGFNRILSLSADGQTLYATDNLGTDKSRLVAIDLSDDQVTELAADEKVDLLPFGAMIDRRGKPQMVLGVYGDARRHFLDAGAEKDFLEVDERLGGGASYQASSANDSIWLMRRLSGGPTKYYTYNRQSGRLTYLFNDFPALDGYRLAGRKAFDLKARDGLQLPVHLYLPPGADANDDGLPDRPLPTILYVHGGPWVGVVQWNQWFHTRNFLLLADRGYAVLNVEFRGSTGMGKAFADAGDREWGRKMHQDLVDIAQWAIQKRIADPDRVGMWGWSYGGYATAAALAFAPELFKTGVAMYGPADLDAFARIPFTDSPLWRQRVGNPQTEEGTALLKAQSPFHHLERIGGPLLLTTGSLDERVPQEQVDAFADALAAAEKEVVYFYYPNEVHDYREDGSWISFWAIAEPFLAKTLGGKVEPPGDDLDKGQFVVKYGQEFVEGLK